MISCYQLTLVTAPVAGLLLLRFATLGNCAGLMLLALTLLSLHSCLWLACNTWPAASLVACVSGPVCKAHACYAMVHVMILPSPAQPSPAQPLRCMSPMHCMSGTVCCSYIPILLSHTNVIQYSIVCRTGDKQSLDRDFQAQAQTPGTSTQHTRLVAG